MKIPINRFSFTEATKVLSAEASDLRDYHVNLNVGFTVLGKTLVEVEFVLANVDRDREQEIQAWNFRLSHQQVQRTPELAGITAVIFND